MYQRLREVTLIDLASTRNLRFNRFNSARSLEVNRVNRVNSAKSLEFNRVNSAMSLGFNRFNSARNLRWSRSTSPNFDSSRRRRRSRSFDLAFFLALHCSQSGNCVSRRNKFSEVWMWMGRRVKT